jgi:rhodanese-related sulfurtransferase
MRSTVLRVGYWFKQRCDGRVDLLNSRAILEDGRVVADAPREGVQGVVEGAGGDVSIVPARDAIAIWRRRAAMFIDVREPREWNLFRIPRAVHVPLGSLADHAHRAPIARPSDLIIVYCGRGNRSRKAAGMLKALGYLSVWSLEGGVMEWIFREGPVEE